MSSGQGTPGFRTIRHYWLWGAGPERITGDKSRIRGTTRRGRWVLQTLFFTYFLYFFKAGYLYPCNSSTTCWASEDGSHRKNFPWRRDNQSVRDCGRSQIQIMKSHGRLHLAHLSWMMTMEQASQAMREGKYHILQEENRVSGPWGWKWHISYALNV